jgi:hypothetical protein
MFCKQLYLFLGSAIHWLYENDCLAIEYALSGRVQRNKYMMNLTVFVCTYTIYHACVCIYVCIYVCMHLCMYVHANNSLSF